MDKTGAHSWDLTQWCQLINLWDRFKPENTARWWLSRPETEQEVTQIQGYTKYPYHSTWIIYGIIFTHLRQNENDRPKTIEVITLGCAIWDINNEKWTGWLEPKVTSERAKAFPQTKTFNVSSCHCALRDCRCSPHSGTIQASCSSVCEHLISKCADVLIMFESLSVCLSLITNLLPPLERPLEASI